MGCLSDLFPANISMTEQKMSMGKIHTMLRDLPMLNSLSYLEDISVLFVSITVRLR